MMRTFPKIETLFNRDEKFKVIPGDFRLPLFESISKWSVSEKIDGTNIRIDVRRDGLGNAYRYRVGGKSDNAEIPPSLAGHLNTLHGAVLDHAYEVIDYFSLTSITLFGEGYGTKIQSGDYYREDQGFILFDVMVDDRLFLSDQVVTETALKLGVPRAPYLGVITTDEVVEACQIGFNSVCAERQHLAEGMILRTVEPLYTNSGDRVVAKLKYKDFAR